MERYARSRDSSRLDNEGLRLGLFLGGLVMAAVPVCVGLGFVVFLYRQFKEERLQNENTRQQGRAP